MTPGYREFRYYSIYRGGEVARLSVADSRGQEYYTIVPAGGKGWRQRRDDALTLVTDAIDRGDPPGEVTT